MIIACPVCATRYVVPDNAIGVEGRTVRCAKCRHSWFQDGASAAAVIAAAPPPPPAPAPAPPPPPPPPPPESPAEPAGAPWVEPELAVTTPHAPPAPVEPVAVVAPEPDPVAPADAPQEWADTTVAAEPELPEPPPSPPPPLREEEPPVAALPAYSEPAYAGEVDDSPSSFAHEPMFRPRRNPARMWMLAAILFATISLGLVGATGWYGLPDWMPFAKPTFAEGQEGLKLDFPAKKQDRHQLPNGTWYFGASGTVTNTSAASRSVPAVLIVLRDARGRIVYSAEVRAPKRVLAPGESVPINEALVDVPKSATRAEFGWKPG